MTILKQNKTRPLTVFSLIRLFNRNVNLKTLNLKLIELYKNKSQLS